MMLAALIGDYRTLLPASGLFMDLLLLGEDRALCDYLRTAPAAGKQMAAEENAAPAKAAAPPPPGVALEEARSSRNKSRVSVIGPPLKISRRSGPDYPRRSFPPREL